MQIDKNGSGSPAPISLYKSTIPSESDYKAVLRGFMFYVVSFIKNLSSSIVRRFDSLTVQITVQKYKVGLFFCACYPPSSNIFSEQRAGHAEHFPPKVLTHYDYFAK